MESGIINNLVELVGVGCWFVYSCYFKHNKYTDYVNAVKLLLRSFTTEKEQSLPAFRKAHDKLSIQHFGYLWEFASRLHDVTAGEASLRSP